MPSPTPRRRSLSRDMAGVFFSRATWTVLSLLSGVILARWLGPHDRGIFALVLLVPATTVTLIKLGISQANVYVIRRHEVSPAAAASNTVTLALISGSLAVAVVWLLREPLIASFLASVPPWALAIGLLRVPLLLIDDYLHGVLQAIGQFRIYNRRLMMGESLRLALIVTFLVGLDGGLLEAVVIQTGVTLVNLLWLVWRVRPVVPFRLGIDPPLLRQQAAFGSKSYVQTVTSHLLLRIDIYMVAYFLGAAETAFYALALRFTELVLEIPQAVGLVLYPKLAGMEERDVHRLTATACRRTIVVVGIAALGLALLGPYVIVLWYGRDYAPAGDPLPWAAFGAVMMGIWVTVTRNFTSRNRQQVNIFAGITALVLNVVLNAFLIPAMGIVGAAIATAISYAVGSAILLAVYRRSSSIPLADVFIAKPEDLRYLGGVVQSLLSRRAGARG